MNERAEQNRLKALEIRKRKMAAQGVSETTPCPPGPLQSTARPTGTVESYETPAKKPQLEATKTTSQLSPEVLKRIEENRRKALEKREALRREREQSSSVPQVSAAPVATCALAPTTTNTKSTMAIGGTVEFYGTSAKKPHLEATKTTSQLSPEVLKRIEENKRKALEKREALRREREQSSSVPQVSAAPVAVTRHRPLPQTTRALAPTTTNTKNTMAVGAVSKPKKCVTVTIVLTSIHNFTARTSMYHQAVIDVFRSITNRTYDSKTHQWSFPISGHSELVAALKPLYPEVEVKPLPQFVLKAIEAAVKKIPASCIDLHGLDTRLLDALLPFQVEGVKFGISLGGRVMLADDMGLGKTIQALGIACHYILEWPLLVVTPSSMKYSWEESVLRWVSSVREEDVRVLTSGADKFRNAKVVVTSYDLLTRRADAMLQHNFGVVILDESHMIKSYKSARYKATAPLMKKAKRVILLSGTPAMSRPSELYTQINGINPSLFPFFHDFGVRYCEGKKEAWSWTYNGSSNTDELQIILQCCVLIRRLKSEVLSQLPPKQRMTVVLDSDLISKKRLKTFDKQNWNFENLESSDSLQQFAKTVEVKVDAVRAYLKEVLESGSKFLVFGHHSMMLDAICSLCQDTKTKFIRIDGSTSPEERMARTSKFQNHEDVRVAVLSITAASTGITLTAAQLVIFAELYWNPGILVQAEDRAHRIGQQDSVTVQYLLAKNTVDDHIWPLLQTKLEVLGKVGLSDDKLNKNKMSYQKCVAQPDIRSFIDKQKSPGECAAHPDIRNFIDKQKSPGENSDPHWNS